MVSNMSDLHRQSNISDTVNMGVIMTEDIVFCMIFLNMDQCFRVIERLTDKDV